MFKILPILLTSTLILSGISDNDIDPIEVPEEYVTDAFEKADIIVEGVSDDIPSGDTVYNFNLDTENIMNRLDGIDNKLSSLSLLGDNSDNLLIEPTYILNGFRVTSTALESASSAYTYVYDLSNISSGYFYSVGNFCRYGYSDVYPNESSFQSYGFDNQNINFNVNLSFNYLYASTYNGSSIYFYGTLKNTEPDNPDNPDIPPIGDDSNILDALNTQTGYLINLSKKFDSMILLLFILTFVPMIKNAIHKIMVRSKDD